MQLPGGVTNHLGASVDVSAVVLVGPGAVTDTSDKFPVGLNVLSGSSVLDWPGGPGLLGLAGNFNGATLQLAYSPDGGTTYINTDGASFTQAGSVLVTFPACKVKLTATGTPTSVNAWLQSTR